MILKQFNSSKLIHLLSVQTGITFLNRLAKKYVYQSITDATVCLWKKTVNNLKVYQYFATLCALLRFTALKIYELIAFRKIGNFERCDLTDDNPTIT
jgi:hypothetical protein